MQLKINQSKRKLDKNEDEVWVQKRAYNEVLHTKTNAKKRGLGKFCYLGSNLNRDHKYCKLMISS